MRSPLSVRIRRVTDQVCYEFMIIKHKATIIHGESICIFDLDKQDVLDAHLKCLL